MTGEDRTKQGGAADLSPMPRTLDLSAEEVKRKSESEPDTAEAAEAQHPSAGASSPEGPPSPGTVETEGPAAGEAVGEPPPPADREPRVVRRGRRRWLVAAVVLLLIAAGAVAYGAISGWLSLPAKGRADEVAALQQRIAELEAGFDRLSRPAAETANDRARLAALDSRLKSLEAGGSIAGPADERWQSLAARLDEAESAITRLGARPAAQGQAGADPEVIARLESGLQELASETAARQRQIDELSGRLDELAKRLTVSVDAARERLGESERAARLAAARSLQTAYERGEPLDPWLDAVEGFTGPDPAIAELRKASPVATLAQLQRGLAETGDRILAAGAPARSGWTARLWANAQSLVRVRPAGPVPGNTPEAILTRVDAALADNRLDLALSEWRQLPEAARQAGQQWQTELEARIAADERLTELLGRLASPAAGG